jgi:hypothetical protein
MRAWTGETRYTQPSAVGARATGAPGSRDDVYSPSASWRLSSSSGGAAVGSTPFSAAT